MRILFLTHYFTPEGNAPATRVYELARRWVRAGHEVTVVTGAPNVPNGVVYPGYENRWRHRETLDGVDTIRVWTYLAANKGTTRRIANYVSFMLTAALTGLFARRPDVVIATSPQFFCGWAGVLVSKLRRLPFVLEVRDLWPESIVAVGAMQSPRVVRLLEWLERLMYRAADHIVTVGAGYRDKLTERGVAPADVSIVPNGVDLEQFTSDVNGDALRARHDLADRFVCSYVGTIGMGSGLAVALRAARLLEAEGRDDVRFLLVGDGAVREELEREAAEAGLRSIVFTGRLPKQQMPEVLAASDACLVHLTGVDLFHTVLPSKIFEAAAMRRPIVLGVRGYAAELVGSAGAGICIEPENERELVAAVEQLTSDPDAARRMGEAGHREIATRFAFPELARNYLDVLQRHVLRTPA